MSKTQTISERRMVIPEDVFKRLVGSSFNVPKERKQGVRSKHGRQSEITNVIWSMDVNGNLIIAWREVVDVEELEHAALAP